MTPRPADRCPYCGGDGVEVIEAWDLLAAEFQVDACCEAAQDEFLSGWDDPAALNGIGIGDWLGSPVRGVHHDGDLRPVIDCRLAILPVRQQAAREFIGSHHRHCPPPPGWRFGLGAYNASRLVGVAWAGRPVARLLDATKVLEVNRLCTLDSPLSRQAASMLLGAVAREAWRRGFERVITYTREGESGASLRGAGWRIDKRSAGGTRSRVGRPRAEHATGRKVRWVTERRGAR